MPGSLSNTLDGLLRLLRPLVGLPAESLARKAEEAILDWTDEPIRDDLCVLVLKPKPQGALAALSRGVCSRRPATL